MKNAVSRIAPSFVCLLALLTAAGCGGLTTATTTAPSSSGVPGTSGTGSGSPIPSGPTAASTAAGSSSSATATGAVTPEAVVTGAVYLNYGRADDYTWVAGQLTHEGSCWTVAYVSPLSKSRPDQYNNRFALVPGDGWSSASVQDGEWVVVHGQPEPGTEPAPGCTAHGYNVTSLQPNPNATSPTGGNSGNGGATLDIQVTQFSVASNFEIRGQFSATNNGSTNIQDLAPARIQVKLPGGKEVFEASAPSIQGGVIDAKPVAGLPPGMSRTYGFSAAPGTISGQITEGEQVTGTLTISAGGQSIEVPLPMTKVTPIRIP